MLYFCYFYAYIAVSEDALKLCNFNAACGESLLAMQCRRMKFQKVVHLRSQMHAVSAKHAERNEVKRSMISGNFEIFLNNPI